MGRVKEVIYNTQADPHHKEITWKYEHGLFFQRVCSSKWVQVQRIHITPDRIKMFMKLIEPNELTII